MVVVFAVVALRVEGCSRLWGICWLCAIAWKKVECQYLRCDTINGEYRGRIDVPLCLYCAIKGLVVRMGRRRDAAAGFENSLRGTSQNLWRA